MTTTTTTTSLRTAQPTATDEDSGFESQSKLGSSSSRPITAAVTEWLKRANSPNLFIMPSATSDDDDDEEDEDDASVCNEPSKNLQGNPMPALSVNPGAEDGCQANRGEFAKPADRAGTRVCETVDEMKAKRSRKSRSAKRKTTKNRKKNQENEQGESVCCIFFFIILSHFVQTFRLTLQPWHEQAHRTLLGSPTRQ